MPPEFMAGCRTPPREWHVLGDDGWTQAWRTCDWGAWRRNADPRRFQAADWAPIADGMYVDADWYTPDTRRVNRELVDFGGQHSAILALVGGGNSAGFMSECLIERYGTPGWSFDPPPRRW